MGKGNLVDAEKYAKMAVDLRPVDVQSRDVLASIYLAEGHSKRAAAQYSAALRYDPDDEQAKTKLPLLVVANQANSLIGTMGGKGKNTFKGVDLSNPNAKKQRSMQDRDSAESSGWSMKQILFGLVVMVVIGVGAAYYMGYEIPGITSDNGTGYTPIKETRRG